MPSLLEVKALKAAYGPTEVLHGIDFGLEPGRITAILGANGAGKTTTLRAICQMVRTSGSAVFEGQQLVRTIWQIARSVVVLPAPLAPRMAVMRPGSRPKSMPCSTSVGP